MLNIFTIVCLVSFLYGGTGHIKQAIWKNSNSGEIIKIEDYDNLGHIKEKTIFDEDYSKIFLPPSTINTLPRRARCGADSARTDYKLLICKEHGDTVTIKQYHYGILYDEEQYIYLNGVVELENIWINHHLNMCIYTHSTYKWIFPSLQTASQHVYGIRLEKRVKNIIRRKGDNIFIVTKYKYDKKGYLDSIDAKYIDETGTYNFDHFRIYKTYWE